MKALEAEPHRRLEEHQAPEIEAIVQRMGLRGMGLTGAWILVMEFFGWRDFPNRREVGSAAGLTGTPYDSGDRVSAKPGMCASAGSWYSWLGMGCAINPRAH